MTQKHKRKKVPSCPQQQTTPAVYIPIEVWSNSKEVSLPQYSELRFESQLKPIFKCLIILKYNYFRWKDNYEKLKKKKIHIYILT